MLIDFHIKHPTPLRCAIKQVEQAAGVMSKITAAVSKLGHMLNNNKGVMTTIYCWKYTMI